MDFIQTNSRETGTGGLFPRWLLYRWIADGVLVTGCPCPMQLEDFWQRPSGCEGVLFQPYRTGTALTPWQLSHKMYHFGVRVTHSYSILLIFVLTINRLARHDTLTAFSGLVLVYRAWGCTHRCLRLPHTMHPPLLNHSPTVFIHRLGFEFEIKEFFGVQIIERTFQHILRTFHD